ncbi:MAG: efflux RND transporter periplasmic adaptor subunit [Acidobacteriota bacterium]
MMIRTRRFLFFVLICCTALGGLLLAQGPVEPPSRELHAGASANDVHALGRIEPAGTVLDIGVPAGNEGSCVAFLDVSEGQRVEAGQLLVRMDSYAVKAARLAEAEAEVEAARARWRQGAANAKQADREAARADIQRLSHRVEAARRTHRRMATLQADGVIAAEVADEARSMLDQAQQEQRRALARLAALEEVRGVDLDSLEAEVAVAEAVVAVALAELDATHVRAPGAGTVLRIHSRQGERPGPDGLMALADLTRMQAVAEVFEGDLERIAVGQTAEVELFSTGETFRGQVSAIGSIVSRQAMLANDPVSDTDARVVEVRVDLIEGSFDTLRRLSNARVHVHIETAARMIDTARTEEDR